MGGTDIDEVFAAPVNGLVASPCYEATIVNNPSSVEDGVKVVIEAFDGNRSFGPLPWSPRVDDAGEVMLPVKGSRALVVFSNEKQAWVIAWWPYE